MQARVQTRALQRKVKLWNPISKPLAFAGVMTSKATELGANERLEKLAEHRQPVFRGKHVDLEASTT
eukprot:9247307-Pyramimonas_sp.AAC.1